MNPVEHQAIVDKGLKMKIKRKNVTGSPSAGSKTDAAKHEIMKADGKSALTPGPQAPLGGGANTEGSSGPVGGATSTLDKLKQTLTDKERINSKQSVSSLARNAHKRTHKDRKDNANHANTSFVMALLANGNTNNGASGTTAMSSSGVSTTNGPLLASNNVMVELNRISNPMSIKKEAAILDPYEFNAKVEDRIGLPVKKVKIEKMENPTSPGVAMATATHTDMETNSERPECRDIGTETSNVSVATDPDCLGPCEPGTSVVLEGIVWNETENGILVVNVTWRGKTYVGTLMDATKHAWAPPRLNCDSPANDDGVRTPRGRGKRGRNAVTPPVIDLGERRLRKRRTNNNNPYAAPPSPAKSEVANGKKRGRPADLDLDLDNIRTSKRSRTTKNAAQNGTNSATPENGFIECPEPNCMKKYRHINGLKYHQAHAHKNYEDTEDNADEKVDAKSPVDDPESNTKDVPPSPSGKGRAGRKISSSTTTTQVDQANSGDAKAENSAPATGKSKKSKKEEKADNKENKKQLDKQATVALTPVSLDSSKTGASVFTSTISSLSTITTVSVLPSTAGTQTTTTATTSTAKLPITTPATATEKPKKVKGEKGDKKGKHRAVVPAPVVLSASTPATASSSHAQISIAANPIQTGGLKPIQPKPTVLGEPASVNPLVGLKEKKVKKKKNKDKDKEREKSKSSDKSSESKSGSVKDVKPELSVLVKSEPSGTLSMGLGGSKPLEALAKMSASPPELQKQGISQLSSIVEKSTVSPPELQKQPPALAKVNSPVKVTESVNTRPPSSLSLNSPVASNADGKDSTNANAQSPAYSDISDANDSSCTVEAEVVEVKKERPPTPEPVKAKATGGDRPSSRGYPGSSVYGGFYPPQAFESPTAGSPQPGKDTQKVPAQMPPSKDSEKPSKPTEPTPVKVERKEEVKEEMGHSPKPNPSPAQMREYQERMMHAQQQMAQYQQYMGAYGYGVDMRAMASNPEYKAQYEWGMMEQERLRREYVAMGKGPDGKGKPGDMSRPLDLNTKAMDLSKQGKMSPAGKPTTVTSNELHSNKPGDSDHSKSKEGMNFPPGELRKDQANCDSLKDMDGKNPPLDGRGPQYPPGFERHQEEYRRYFMYQQQRLMEHKRYMEQQGGKEGDRKPPHPLNRDNPGPHPLNREQNGPHPLNREQIGPHPLNREQIGPHPLNREQNGPHPLNREQNGPHPHHREKTGPHPLNRDQPGPHQLNRDQPGQHVPSPHGHHGQPQHAQSPHAPSPHGQPPHGQLPRGQPMPHSHSPHGQAPHGRDQQHAAGRDPHSRDSQMPRDQSGQRTENQSPYNKGHPHHREHDSRPNSGHPHHDPRANSEHKSDKDKSKSGGKLSSSLPASPAGKPKEQRDPAQNAYGQHGQQFYPQGYPGYTGHVPFDPSHAMYQQNPALGYAASPNNYPQYAGPHMRGNHPENFKDGGKAGTLSPSGRGSQDGKALELLQKAANYHNSHSPHAPHPKLKDMKDGMRPDKGSLPSPVKDGDRPESRGSNVSTGKDKERKSPPTLRHVHTHHHTHTVGPAYSLYGPYGSSSIMASPGAPETSTPYTPAK